jgi:Zn-dependent protease
MINLQNLNPFNIIVTVIPFLLCITIHELAHGYVAFKLGDNTAKSLGRLTLNPIKHIDLFGLIMIILVGFGWAKPVPVDMRNFKHPKKYMSITALAGPVSNILLAAVVMFLFGMFFTIMGFRHETITAILIGNVQGVGGIIGTLLLRTAVISLMLAVFNMFPIPPLDGSKVLFSLLPDSTYMSLMRIERFGFILLIILLQVDAFRGILFNAQNTLFRYFTHISEFAFSLVN